MVDPVPTPAEWLSGLIESKELTAAGVADRAGVTPNAVYKAIQRGSVSNDILLSAAEILGYSADETLTLLRGGPRAEITVASSAGAVAEAPVPNTHTFTDGADTGDLKAVS